MYSVLERFNQQAAAQPQPQQPQRPATQAAPVPGETLADEDYINGAQLKRYLAGQAPQYVQPQLQQLYAQNASTAISLVQQQFPDDFKRYGAEIHSRIALMPLEYRTVDNLVSQVKFVRSEHLDQLVEEKAEARAQEMRAQMASGLRSSGAPIGGPGPTDNGNTAGYLQNEVIPDKWKRLAEKVNLTESTLQDFCRQNDMTPEQFVELFKGNVMIDTMATGSLKEDRVKTI